MLAFAVCALALPVAPATSALRGPESELCRGLRAFELGGAKPTADLDIRFARKDLRQSVCGGTETLATDSRGGAAFLKTTDDQFVLKSFKDEASVLSALELYQPLGGTHVATQMHALYKLHGTWWQAMPNAFGAGGARFDIKGSVHESRKGKKIGKDLDWLGQFASGPTGEPQLRTSVAAYREAIGELAADLDFLQEAGRVDYSLLLEFDGAQTLGLPTDRGRVAFAGLIDYLDKAETEAQSGKYSAEELAGLRNGDLAFTLAQPGPYACRLFYFAALLLAKPCDGQRCADLTRLRHARGPYGYPHLNLCHEKHTFSALEAFAEIAAELPEPEPAGLPRTHWVVVGAVVIATCGMAFARFSHGKQ